MPRLSTVWHSIVNGLFAVILKKPDSSLESRASTRLLSISNKTMRKETERDSCDRMVNRQRKGALNDNLIRREDTGLALAISDEEAASLSDGAVTLSSGEKVRLIGGDVKKAKLEYEVIAKNNETSLLRIHLLTGRFHQIRVQLSSRNMPIVGDEKYGSSESIEYSKKIENKAVCVGAYSFSFRHPGTKKRVTFEILPDNKEIKELLAKL